MRFSFVTAAAKHLSMVEIDKLSSNQHEFNGVSTLRQMFGYSKQKFDATFIYYSEDGEELKNYGELTWYDAREAHLTRREYRLYYTENNVVKLANVGDLLIVGKKEDNSVIVIVAKNGCEYYNLFMQLFGLSSITSSYTVSNDIFI